MVMMLNYNQTLHSQSPEMLSFTYLSSAGNYCLLLQKLHLSS